jgi:hypothetical protein
MPDNLREMWRRYSTNSNHSAFSSVATEYWNDETVGDDQHEMAEQLSNYIGYHSRDKREYNMSEWGSMGTLMACCGSRSFSEQDLTHEDRCMVGAIREYTDQAYDRGSFATDEALLELWNTAFPTATISESDNDPRWLRLGFSSSIPSTDGAGQVGLNQLQYLAANYPTRFKRLVRQSKDLKYPFASSCFNVTRLVLAFFNLSDGDSPLQGVDRASLWQMTNFLALYRSAQNEEGESVLDELFCALVDKVHMKWVELWVGPSHKSRDPTGRGNEVRVLSAVFDANSKFWSEPRHDLNEVTEISGLKL